MDTLEPALRLLFPIMRYYQLPLLPSVALVLALLIIFALLFFYMVYKSLTRPKPRPPTYAPQPSLELAVASRLDVVQSQNARLMAERDELFRWIGTVLGERPPNNHDSAIGTIREHHEIYTMMVEALEEGSPQWSALTRADGSHTIMNYLYDLADAGLRANQVQKRAQEDQDLLTALQQVQQEHLSATTAVIQTFMTAPNQQVPVRR